MARPKHRTKPGATYFITTDTWQRRALFRNTTMAQIVERRLFGYRDKGFYLVHRSVVMSDHFHVILTPGENTALEKAVQLIKGGASHEIGKKFRSRLPIWHAGFTEHQIRDQTDYDTHVSYIDMNPVEAGLARQPGDYPFCSARGEHRHDPWPVASGAKALEREAGGTAGLKPRPSKSEETKLSPHEGFNPVATRGGRSN